MRLSSTVPQKEGEPKVLEQKCASGQHLIQFQAKPFEDGLRVALQLGYGKQEAIQTAELPHALGEPPAEQPLIVNTIGPGESVSLLKRSLRSSQDTLRFEVRLQPIANEK